MQNKVRVFLKKELAIQDQLQLVTQAALPLVTSRGKPYRLPGFASNICIKLHFPLEFFEWFKSGFKTEQAEYVESESDIELLHTIVKKEGLPVSKVPGCVIAGPISDTSWSGVLKIKALMTDENLSYKQAKNKLSF